MRNSCNMITLEDMAHSLSDSYSSSVSDEGEFLSVQTSILKAYDLLNQAFDIDVGHYTNGNESSSTESCFSSSTLGPDEESSDNLVVEASLGDSHSLDQPRLNELAVEVTELFGLDALRALDHFFGFDVEAYYETGRTNVSVLVGGLS